MNRKGKNAFWGLLLIFCAVFLILQEMGFLNGIHISIWTVIWTIFCGRILWQGIAKREFFSIFLAIAFLCIIYDDVLGLQAITPWPVLGAAVLLSIGCNMLFPKRNTSNHFYIGEKHSGEYTNETDGELVCYEVNFASAINYVKSQNLQSGKFECNFGSLKIDFSQAAMGGSEAYIKIDNNFGTTVLFIPSDWLVVDQISSTFGGVDVKGTSQGGSGCTLYLEGETNFGNVTIQYI